MNEEIATEILSWLQAGKEIVSIQAPLVAKEFIIWTQIYHGLIGLILLFVLSGLIYIDSKALSYLKISFGKKEENTYDVQNMLIFGVVVITFISIFLLAVFISEISIVIKSFVAPRLLIIEYMKTFVN